jgi:hypothetical protein
MVENGQNGEEKHNCVRPNLTNRFDTCRELHKALAPAPDWEPNWPDTPPLDHGSLTIKSRHGPSTHSSSRPSLEFSPNLAALYKEHDPPKKNNEAPSPIARRTRALANLRMALLEGHCRGRRKVRLTIVLPVPALEVPSLTCLYLHDGIGGESGQVQAARKDSGDV